MKMLILLFGILSSIAYGKDLKILSLNTHCIDRDWDYRLEEISKLIVSKKPDLIFFQELCDGKGGNSFQNLIDKFESKNLHYPYRVKQFTHDAWDGLFKEYIAVFSAHDFNKIDQGWLPYSPMQRGYIAVNVLDHWIVNTHLEHNPNYAEYRKAQVEFLSFRFANLRTIIGGDFNSESNSYEQQAFLQFDFFPAFAGPTFPASNPSLAIDGFWLSRSIRNEIKSYQISRLTELNTLSDHLAVEIIVTI